MANTEHQDKMLEATFGFARLALTNAVLLNGAAATALLAFLGTASVLSKPALTTAVLWFGSGAVAAGFASMLAYLGQRQNWEWSKFEHMPTAESRKAKTHGIAASVLIWLAILLCTYAFVAFGVGAKMASDGLHTLAAITEVAAGRECND